MLSLLPSDRTFAFKAILLFVRLGTGKNIFAFLIFHEMSNVLQFERNSKKLCQVH